MKRIWFDKINLALLPASLITVAAAITGRHVFDTPPQARAIRNADLRPQDRARLPFISVIVPARNEERNLPRLLPSLLAQDYPAELYEVIVVDDNSDDATPLILSEFVADERVRVVQGAPLAEGWAGKPHAMMQGAAAANPAANWLLFTDADTVFAPHALTTAWYDADLHHADLFSVAPSLQLETFWEKVIMPIVTTAIYVTYAPSKVNDPQSKVAIANGQFIFIRRSVYDAVGGIAVVKSEIIEDLRFAETIKRRGYRLYLTDGRNIMQVRMYTNFAEVWAGWSKNAAFGVADNPALAVVGTLALTSTAIFGPALPFIFAGRLLNRLRRGKAQPADSLALAQSVFQVGTAALFLRRIEQNLGLPARYLLTAPLGGAIFLAIIANSLFRLLSGKGVQWKGRTYQRQLLNLQPRLTTLHPCAIIPSNNHRDL